MSVILLREIILPAAFNRNGTTVLGCEIESEGDVGRQFQSSVLFITAMLSDNNAKTKIPIVVKFEPVDKDKWTVFNTPLQFNNEVLMYRDVLPFLEKHDIVKNTFPALYYGVSNIEDPVNDVLLIQDLRSLGYKLPEEKVFISAEHVSIAVAKLGRFHALSYATKTLSPEMFFSSISCLKEVSWLISNGSSPMISACFHRAIDPLIAQGKHVQVFQKLLKLVDEDLVSFIRNLVTPEEPTAVLCHGDFCRNNTLFKYNEYNKPVDVMFFDLATARYSSPVIDLAFFIYLNSSKQVRDAHLDDWLREYHKAVATAIPGIEVPSLEDIEEEFKQKAIYAFVHCSFFLPIMLYIDNFDDPLDEDDAIPFQARIGGEEGTKLLSNMITEFVDRGFLTLEHKYLSEFTA